MNKIEIEIPDGKKAEWVNNVLTLVDDKPQDVTERIKIFEDALYELEVRAANGDNTVKMLYDDWHNVTTDSKDLIAYLQLRIITAALNEGWEPKFIPGECRWAPYFILYTKEEIEKMNAKEKARVVYRSYNSANAYGGVSYADAHHGSAVVDAGISSRLAFKSEKLAAYAGRQFAEIYADFCFKPKDE